MMFTPHCRAFATVEMIDQTFWDHFLSKHYRIFLPRALSPWG